MKQSHLFLIFAFLLGFSIQAFSQKDTILLRTVEISTQRTPVIYSESARVVTIITQEEIEASPAQSLNQLLETALNIDIRQRGADEVQADINTRAGSFEQTLILLNGIKMNDPQTGHHNLNLPIALEDIERIEILDGPGSRVYGANAFSGAINIITKNTKKKYLKARISGGQYGYFNGGISTAYDLKNNHSFLSLSRKSSSGYTNNTDFKIGNLFYQLQNIQDFGTFNLQVGYKDKSFGAQSFYTPKYPNQFEQTKTTFGSLSFKHKGKFTLKQNIYWRRNQDRFELFRSNPAPWYSGPNYHLTDTYGAEFNGSYSWKIFRSAIGFEFRSENILSNVLGKVLKDSLPVPGEPEGHFTHQAQRNSISFFAEQGLYSPKFSLSVGAMSIYYSDFKWHFYSGIDAAYNITPNSKLYASANQSLRLPTFTDLYYQGPTNRGNPNLKPEEALTYEIGFKYLAKGIQFNIGIFQRKGKNIIDWIKLNSTDKWQSQNLTKLTTQGIESHLRIQPELILTHNFPLESIELNFSYNTATKYSGNYISNYALDFLKTKISLSLTHKIYSGLSATWQALYQDRNGSYTSFDYAQNTYGDELEYPAFSLFNFRINYTHKTFTFFVSIDNALNKQYYDLGNIVMPGRWTRAGVSYRLPL